MEAFDAGRIDDLQQVVHEAVEGPAVVARRDWGFAESAHVEAQQSVAGGEHRQPVRPDVRVGADSVVEDDRLRVVDPGRDYVEEIVEERSGSGVDQRRDECLISFGQRPSYCFDQKD